MSYPGDNPKTRLTADRAGGRGRACAGGEAAEGGVSVLAVGVRAEDNGCDCPACQLCELLAAAGHDVDGEAFADAHAFCTSPAATSSDAGSTG